MFDWDEAKRQANLAKHGVDFADVAKIEWTTVEHYPDARRDYGEARVVTLGYIGQRLHVLTWTPRYGLIRVINLRKANDREVRKYRQNIA